VGHTATPTLLGCMCAAQLGTRRGWDDGEGGGEGEAAQLLRQLGLEAEAVR
jgi:hypothetical protein